MRGRASSEWPRLATTGEVVAGVATLVALDPEKTRLVAPCPLRAVGGIDCPGCGTGRCLYDLVHGDVAAAFDHNPLTMLFVPVSLFALVVWWAPSLRRPWMTRVVASRVTTWALVAVMLVFSIVRNTPTPLGRYLASG